MSRKELDKARGQSCVRCGLHDDTIVSCHYTGIRSHAFGKGMGCKPNDFYVTFLCFSCHNIMDGRTPSDMTKLEKSEEFLFLILQTKFREYDGSTN